MGRVVYQVRLVLKPEEAGAFNTWYEGEYIPKLMRETPHFTAVRRYQAEYEESIGVKPSSKRRAARDS